MQRTRYEQLLKRGVTAFEFCFDPKIVHFTSNIDFVVTIVVREFGLARVPITTVFVRCIF